MTLCACNNHRNNARKFLLSVIFSNSKILLLWGEVKVDNVPTVIDTTSGSICLGPPRQSKHLSSPFPIAHLTKEANFDLIWALLTTK